MTTCLTYQDDVLPFKGSAPPFSSPDDHALFKARFDKTIKMAASATSLTDWERDQVAQVRAWAMQRFKLYEDAEAKARADNVPYVPHYQEYNALMAANRIAAHDASPLREAPSASMRAAAAAAHVARAIQFYQHHKNQYNALMAANQQKYIEMDKEEFMFKDMASEKYNRMMSYNDQQRESMMANEKRALKMMEMAKSAIDSTI
jgi:hypothetical protein